MVPMLQLGERLFVAVPANEELVHLDGFVVLVDRYVGEFYDTGFSCLGGGDVKFVAAAGLFLGFARIIPATLYGTILAALTGLALIALKKIGRKDKMPLAPFLYI